MKYGCLYLRSKRVVLNKSEDYALVEKNIQHKNKNKDNDKN